LCILFASSCSDDSDSDRDKPKKGPAGKASAASVAAPSKAKGPVNAAEVESQIDKDIARLTEEVEGYKRELYDPATPESVKLKLLDNIRASRENATELLRQKNAGQFYFFCPSFN